MLAGVKKMNEKQETRKLITVEGVLHLNDNLLELQA
jgi:hypothetical protein